MKSVTTTPQSSEMPVATDANVKQAKAASVEYEGGFERLNASFQLNWSRRMEDGYGKAPSLYKHVKVLSISWDESLDGLGTKKEVCIAVNSRNWV